jgi:seryl-tRNA synthetase
MTAEAIAELVKQGVLGVLLVVSGGIVYMLWRSLERERDERTKAVEALQTERARAIEEVQKARIEDARAHRVELLELTRASVGALAASANAQTAVKESVDEVRGALADYNETLREYLNERRPLPPPRPR